LSARRASAEPPDTPQRSGYPSRWKVTSSTVEEEVAVGLEDHPGQGPLRERGVGREEVEKRGILILDRVFLPKLEYCRPNLLCTTRCCALCDGLGLSVIPNTAVIRETEGRP